MRPGIIATTSRTPWPTICNWTCAAPGERGGYQDLTELLTQDLHHLDQACAEVVENQDNSAQLPPFVRLVQDNLSGTTSDGTITDDERRGLIYTTVTLAFCDNNNATVQSFGN